MTADQDVLSLKDRISIWLEHKKYRYIGDKELHDKGKIIRCRFCGTRFKSYCHYRGWSMSYDAECDRCGILMGLSRR